MLLLHDLAHSRAGDKGDTSTLSVIAYREQWWDHLVREVTAERVRSWLVESLRGPVIRYELPALLALHFVCRNALHGGVTTSLALDAHGKGLSFRLLAMPVARPQNFPLTDHDPACA